MELISNLVEAHIFREMENGIEFLLLKRSEDEIFPGVWQMVSGKIKDGEKSYETAVRELKEETGLIPEQIWVAPRVNSFYSHETDRICFVPVFAIKVKSDKNVFISKEHCDFKWCRADEAKKLLAWDGQRKALELIREYFLYEKSYLKFVEINLK
ncbi:8-oxo-dGTP diphosphatase [bacterium BMS3Abin03]|nr:8-oxo-dGTP diphosphatase [bacterium BMS3Abin03]